MPTAGLDLPAIGERVSNTYSEMTDHISDLGQRLISHSLADDARLFRAKSTQGAKLVKTTARRAYLRFHNRSTERVMTRRGTKFRNLLEEAMSNDVDVEREVEPAGDAPPGEGEAANFDEVPSSDANTTQSDRSSSISEESTVSNHCSVESRSGDDRRPYRPKGGKSRDHPKPRKLSRGERALDLAFAIEVKFGQMPPTEACRATARRWASEHALVVKTVRNCDKAWLINRAVVAYFTVSDTDMIAHKAIFSKKNVKRAKVLGLGPQ